MQTTYNFRFLTFNLNHEIDLFQMERFLILLVYMFIYFSCISLYIFNACVYEARTLVRVIILEDDNNRGKLYIWSLSYVPYFNLISNLPIMSIWSLSFLNHINLVLTVIF